MVPTLLNHRVFCANPIRAVYKHKRGRLPHVRHYVPHYSPKAFAFGDTGCMRAQKRAPALRLKPSVFAYPSVHGAPLRCAVFYSIFRTVAKKLRLYLRRQQMFPPNSRAKKGKILKERAGFCFCKNLLCLKHRRIYFPNLLP